MDLTTDGVFRRYESIRHRLPAMPAVIHTRAAGGLIEIASEIDVFIFDAFGVLVVGNTAISGAAATVRELKRSGKTVLVLTNAATHDRAAQHAKYKLLGYPFDEDEIVSSRDVLIASLAAFPHVGRWGAIVPADGSVAGLPDNTVTLGSDAFWDVDGYLWLSSQGWTPHLQDRLVQRLKVRSAPILVGNPDIVAPREGGLTREPGFFAHDLLDRLDCDIRFFGKPYRNAFDAAIAAASDLRGEIDRSRVVMVGDTLHTDILGGAAAGLRTVLVTDHGVLKDTDPTKLVETSGIRPDWIVPSI